MKLRALLVALVVLASSSPSFAASPPVPGSNCKKIGQIRIFKESEFKCIKRGKGLVWSSGKALKKRAIAAPAKPTISPTPTAEATPSALPSPSPTQTEVNMKELDELEPTSFRDLAERTSGIAAKVWRDGQSLLSIGTVKSRFEITYGPSTSAITGIDSPIKVLEQASKFWSGFEQPKTVKVFVRNFTDQSWAQQQLRALNGSWFTPEDLAQNCSSAESCNSLGGTYDGVGQLFIGVSSRPSLDSLQARSNLVHEFTHSVHYGIKEQASRVNGYAFLPCWFSEGQARLAGDLVASESLTAYRANRFGPLSRPAGVLGNYSKESILKFFSLAGQSRGGSCNQAVRPRIYDVGYLSVEALAAVKGSAATMELALGIQQGLTFEDSFQRVYGLDWKEASNYLAQAISNQFPNTTEALPTPSPSATARSLTFTERIWGRSQSNKFPIEELEFSIPAKLPTDWSDVVDNREGIPYKAWKSISDSMKNSAPKLGKYKILQGPNTIPNYQDFQFVMEQVSRAFPTAKEVENLNIFLYNFRDMNWADQKFRETYANETEFFKSRHANSIKDNCQPLREVCWAMAFVDSNFNGIMLIGAVEAGSSIQLGQRYDEFVRSDRGSVIAHEYLHTVQRKILGNRWFQIDYTPPIWFNEGMAVFVENAVTNHQSWNGYMQFRAVDGKLAYIGCRNTVHSCVDVKLEVMTDFLSLKHYQDNWGKFDYTFKYPIASRVIEVLVALKGSKSLIDLYSYMSDGNTFEAAFQHVYGLRYVDAIPTLAKLVVDSFSEDR